MKKETQNTGQDRHLDVPAEANREKHHNFLADADEEGHNAKLTERQKEWKEGLEEGRRRNAQETD